MIINDEQADLRLKYLSRHRFTSVRNMAAESSNAVSTPKLYFAEIHPPVSTDRKILFFTSLGNRHRRDTAREWCLAKTEIARIDRGAKQIGPDNTETRG